MLAKLFSGTGALAAVIVTAHTWSRCVWYENIGKAVASLIVCTFGANVLGIVGLFAISEIFVDMNKPQEKPSKFFRKMMEDIADYLVTSTRIRLHVTGEEKLPTEGRFLLVCNHRSLFDPIVKLSALRGTEVAYMTKPQNYKIPVAGRLMHKCCCLQLDRENNREAFKAIKRAGELIDQDLCSIGIYPEGTRNKGEGILPLHNGSFKIAQRTGVPIVVVTVKNTDLVIKRMPFRPTDVYIDILDVISAEDAKRSPTSETAQRVWNIMSEHYNKL